MYNQIRALLERVSHRGPLAIHADDHLSIRLSAIIVLIAAIGLGAHLRFERLGAAELNRDEGASWTAATAPTIAQVQARESVIDPGKLAVYHIALHCWISLFGDSAVAMRSISAILGMVSIILFFFCVRTAWLILSTNGALPLAELAGAFAALLMATNLAVATADRTARMYSLMIAATLIQMLFFLRLHRFAGIINYAGTAFFTTLALAVNFTAGFFLFAEGLWLLILQMMPQGQRTGLSVLRPAVGVAGGIVLLFPLLAGEVARSYIGVSVLDWVSPQPLAWPLTVLAKVSGGMDPYYGRATPYNWGLFLISVTCLASALWRLRVTARLLIEYLLVWTVGPLLCVALVSWLIHPIEVPRYVLMGFLGILALIGVGMASFGSRIVHLAIVVLVVHSAWKIDQGYLRNPSEDLRWGEATHLALQHVVPGGTIAVFPPGLEMVVRYALEPRQRAFATSATRACEPNSVLILALAPPPPLAQLRAKYECYPTLIAELPYLQVRTQENHAR